MQLKIQIKEINSSDRSWGGLKGVAFGLKTRLMPAGEIDNKVSSAEPDIQVLDEKRQNREIFEQIPA